MRRTVLPVLRAAARTALAVTALAVAVFGPAAAQSLTPATQKLFDAVWADDLAGVRASISAGAKLDAVNEFGVRPVDMAVDKGHYDIAHYLLSVDKLRRDSALQARREREFAARQPVAARAPAARPAPTQAPAPAPAPRVAVVTDVPRAPAGQSAAVQPLPVNPPPAPVAPKAAPSGKPQRESLWAPSAPETAPEAPVIRVARVAKPVAVPPPAPAAEAQSAPAAAEAAAPTGTQTQTNSSASGWPDQVTSLFSLSESESAVAAEPKAQAETQAQAQAEIPAQAQEPAPVVQSGVRRIGAPPPTPAPVETAAAPDPAPVPTTVNPAQPPPSMVSAAPLKGVSFRIGENHALGTAIPKDGPRRSLCVDKSHWSTMFCIEPVIWPAAMADHFQVTNNFYRGRQSIVQYQGGNAVQIHVLFPKDRLRAVTEHFKAVYGPPTDQPEILTALIGEPKRINRTVQWRSRDAKGAETVLEIREIDDLRWSAPPDTNHGVVRLYGADQGSVFELLSATDLLLVNIRRGS